MRTLKLNEAQQAAVAEFDHDLLVNAGAGTGKTLVLVEKFLQIISDGRARADQITAITFTNKAAAEMRNRVRSAIRQQAHTAATVDERRRWEEEGFRFEAARIGTFHSFCLGLIHQYPLELELPPVNTVLGEGEERIYLNEAYDQALTELLTRREDGDDRSQVLAEMLIAADHAYFRKNIIQLYRKIREGGRGYPELFQMTQAALEAELQQMIPAPADLIESIEALLHFAGTQALTPKARMTLADFRAEWPHYRKILAEDDGPAIIPVLAVLKKQPYLQQAVFKESIKETREMAALLLRRQADREAMRRLPSLISILETLDRHYQAMKREAALLDFSDLQLYARELLRNHPQVAAALRREIQYLLVDEFQDTNGLQLELIRLLLGAEPAGPGGRWMAVGDIKQSIYRFRGAEADVIQGLEREFRKSGRSVVPLTVNYRSSRVIIDYANAVCGELFRDEAFDYIPLQTEATSESGPITILLGEDAAAEVRLVARQISQLKGEGHSYGEMAMLFRTTTKIDRYQQALKDAAIPFYRTGGYGFYNTAEVRDQLNLLALVEQGNDSLALLALLTSPYVVLGVESLYWLGCEAGLLYSFYQLRDCPPQVPADEWERLVSFREMLQRLRTNRAVLTIADIIRMALAESDYRAVLWSQPHAGQRLANLEKLLAKAEEFAVRGFHDLPRFREYIEDLETAGAEEGEAPVENEAGEAVRLMTIHAAKGLEFPIVFLPNLDQSFRNQSEGRIAYHKEIGLALAIDTGGDKPESSAWSKLKELNQREELAERKRLLYVALTRPRDQLVLSGVPSKQNGKSDSWLKWLEKMMPMEQGETLEWRGVPLRIIRKLQVPAPPEPAASLLRTHGPRLLAEEPHQDAAILFTPLKVHSGRPLRFNVSELLAWKDCGRRYFWKYRMRMTEPLAYNIQKPDTAGNIGAALGDFFHQAVRRGGGEWPEVLWDAFRREKGLDGATATKLQDDLQRIWTHYQGSRFTGQSGECWQEVPFIVKLGEGLQIEGRFDRLLQTIEGKLVLVDFKTHRRTTGIEETAQSYFWQLQLYALAIKALWGRLPDEATLYFPFSNTEVPVPLDEKALIETVNAIKESAALIDGGVELLDFSIAEDCRDCGYQLFCNPASGVSSS